MKSYNHFTIEERICIEGLLKNGENISGIARKLGRNKSSVSEKLRGTAIRMGNIIHGERTRKQNSDEGTASASQEL